MRQELVSLAALAADQEGYPTHASLPGRWRRRLTPLVLASGAAAAALVLAATVWLLPDPGDGDPSATGTSPRDTTSSQATPSTPAPGQRRCWDGQAPETASGCSTPSGIQGLLWVYPSFKQDRVACQRVVRPLSPRKVLAYFCPFTEDNPAEGIRYSEWVSASAAREIITRDFSPWPETGVEREGYTWSVWIRESSDERGSFSTAVAYRDWPFSAEVVSNTRRAASLACNIIELRAPDTYRRVTALCGSSD
jgi:hypothetical protein